jgi:hypothetical protein
MPEAAEFYRRCAAAVGQALQAAPRGRCDDAALYLAHVEGSTPLRGVAEAAGRTLSSVHRAVRRVEALRDDPLFDRALEALGEALRGGGTTPVLDPDDETRMLRALRALAAPQAFLLVASEAERAGVFGPENAFARPLSVLSVTLAAHMAARDWLRPASRSRLSIKYVLGEAGRARLVRRVAPPRRERGPAVEDRPEAASPVERLASRGLLTPLERVVGERFRAAWLAAGSPPPDRVEAETPFAAAMAALGPGLAQAAYAACCAGEGLERLERRMGWSARSGKVVLKIALEHLASHDASIA